MTLPDQSDSLAELLEAGDDLERLVRMATLDPRRRVIVERWVGARRAAQKWDRAMQRSYESDSRHGMVVLMRLGTDEVSIAMPVKTAELLRGFLELTLIPEGEGVLSALRRTLDEALR